MATNIFANWAESYYSIFGYYTYKFNFELFPFKLIDHNPVYSLNVKRTPQETFTPIIICGLSLGKIAGGFRALV